jgi:hypothetical protein
MTVKGDEFSDELDLSIKHIEEWLYFIYNEYKNAGEDLKIIEKIFDKKYLSESNYYWIKKVSDYLEYPLASLEKIGEDIDVEPQYDCKTAKEWQEENNHIVVIMPIGFPEGSWDTERIPYGAYCYRRRNSECDSTGHINFLKENCREFISSINETIAAEAKPGQKIEILSGSCNNKFATVIDLCDDRPSMKIQLEGKEYPNIISKTNKVRIINEDFSQELI